MITVWDGTYWSNISGGGFFASVQSFSIYNGELHIGGGFDIINNRLFRKIAKWNGTQWLEIGGGFSNNTDVVRSLFVYNNELYVGGNFSNAGNISANNIAKWNGTSWAALGNGVNGSVGAIASYIKGWSWESLP